MAKRKKKSENKSQRIEKQPDAAQALSPATRQRLLLETWAGVPINDSTDFDLLKSLFIDNYRDQPLPRKLAEIGLGSTRVRQLEQEGLALTKPVPRWDGTAITWRGRTEWIRIQDNSVIPQIFTVLEGSGWPRTVEIPESAEGDLKQACYAFNKRNLFRLSVNKRNVSWFPDQTKN